MTGRGAKVVEQGWRGWYVAKSGGGSGRRYVCMDALMVTSGCDCRHRRRSGVIVVVSTTGDEPSH